MFLIVQYDCFCRIPSKRLLVIFPPEVFVGQVHAAVPALAKMFLSKSLSEISLARAS
jgi:hypothetical protein